MLALLCNSVNNRNVSSCGMFKRLPLQFTGCQWACVGVIIDDMYRFDDIRDLRYIFASRNPHIGQLLVDDAAL